MKKCRKLQSWEVGLDGSVSGVVHGQISWFKGCITSTLAEVDVILKLRLSLATIFVFSELIAVYCS